MARLLSIGYEGHTPETFVEELEWRGVKRLIDVRALPFSRKKGFSKNPLREMLEANGIEYVHCQVAGNPFREKKEASLPIYAMHLAEHPEILPEFTQHFLKRGMTAVMCYERDAEQCHRSVLLQAVSATGCKIFVARSE
ncbi:MAG TPA: DUF488 domain-containing protein [bacterium]|nr:DUF488 domain-containing protein [bacterium]